MQQQIRWTNLWKPWKTVGRLVWTCTMVTSHCCWTWPHTWQHLISMCGMCQRSASQPYTTIQHNIPYPSSWTFSAMPFTGECQNKFHYNIGTSGNQIAQYFVLCRIFSRASSLCSNSLRPRGKESTEIQKSQIKGKESENSYQELKRSLKDRQTQTLGNCIEIFLLARPSLSIGRE